MKVMILSLNILEAPRKRRTRKIKFMSFYITVLVKVFHYVILMYRYKVLDYISTYVGYLLVGYIGTIKGGTGYLGVYKR